MRVYQFRHIRAVRRLYRRGSAPTGDASRRTLRAPAGSPGRARRSPESRPPGRRRLRSRSAPPSAGPAFCRRARRVTVPDLWPTRRRAAGREPPPRAGKDPFASGESYRDAATLSLRADVAELVDAHGSGPCGRKPVEVQVLSSASPNPGRAWPEMWPRVDARQHGDLVLAALPARGAGRARARRLPGSH